MAISPYEDTTQTMFKNTYGKQKGATLGGMANRIFTMVQMAKRLEDIKKQAEEPEETNYDQSLDEYQNAMNKANAKRQQVKEVDNLINQINEGLEKEISSPEGRAQYDQVMRTIAPGEFAGGEDRRRPIDMEGEELEYDEETGRSAELDSGGYDEGSFSDDPGLRGAQEALSGDMLREMADPFKDIIGGGLATGAYGALKGLKASQLPGLMQKSMAQSAASPATILQLMNQMVAGGMTMEEAAKNLNENVFKDATQDITETGEDKLDTGARLDPESAENFINQMMEPTSEDGKSVFQSIDDGSIAKSQLDPETLHAYTAIKIAQSRPKTAVGYVEKGVGDAFRGYDPADFYEDTVAWEATEENTDPNVAVTMDESAEVAKDAAKMAELELLPTSMLTGPHKKMVAKMRGEKEGGLGDMLADAAPEVGGGGFSMEEEGGERLAFGDPETGMLREEDVSRFKESGAKLSPADPELNLFDVADALDAENGQAGFQSGSDDGALRAAAGYTGPAKDPDKGISKTGFNRKLTTAMDQNANEASREVEGAMDLGEEGGWCIIVTVCTHRFSPEVDITRRYRDEIMTDQDLAGYYEIARIVVPRLLRSYRFKAFTKKWLVDRMIDYFEKLFDYTPKRKYKTSWLITRAFLLACKVRGWFVTDREPILALHR